MKKMSKLLGFTLLELMIIVAMVAILASIAVPSYKSHIDKSKEAEAQAALLSFANTMSQYYLDGMTYLGAAGTKAVPSDTGSPWIFSSTVPLDGGTVTYNLSITTPLPSDTAFELTASPVDASLTTFTINQTGTITCNRNGLDITCP